MVTLKIQKAQVGFVIFSNIDGKTQKSILTTVPEVIKWVEDNLAEKTP